MENVNDKITRTMENLRLNKMKPYFAESREQLNEIIRKLVNSDKLITSGG